MPEGVANLLTGYGHTAGAAITAHPGVEKVAFTGSTEVGKEIVRAAAGNLKKVTLELGGKSPVLIFDDADLDKAILMASLGIFVHSGQGCVVGQGSLCSAACLTVCGRHFDDGQHIQVRRAQRGRLRQRPAEARSNSPGCWASSMRAGTMASRWSPAATGWTARATSCTRRC